MMFEVQRSFGNALAGGMAMGEQNAQSMQRQNQQALFAEHGAGIANGDQNSINALAGMDPMAALGVRNTIADNRRADAGLDMQREGLGMRREELDMRKQQIAAETARSAAAMSAAERQAAQAEIESAMRGLTVAQTPEQFERLKQSYMQSNPDMDLSGVRFEDRAVLAAELEGIAEGLKIAEGPKGNAPLSPAGKLAADLQAGIITPEQYNMANQKSGMRVSSDGKGGFVFEQGVGVTGNDPADVSNPSSPAAMSATIEGILNDPALDTATGMLSLTQKIPGTGQYRFGTRAKQLEGQAFLQAFESLKGAGQITEIEGTKATQAIGRLDTAQSPDDYRQALTDLKDVLDQAAGRPVGWAQQQTAKPADVPSISDEAGYNALPSGAVFMAPDGTQRRKP